MWQHGGKMLSDEQLNTILDKTILEPEDIFLLHHHLREIKKMQEEYGDTLPSDVVITTNVDCDKIAKRCQEFLNNSEGVLTLDLLQAKGVDLEEVKKGYEAKANMYENRAQNLQFEENRLQDAKRFWRMADLQKKAAEEISAGT